MRIWSFLFLFSFVAAGSSVAPVPVKAMQTASRFTDEKSITVMLRSIDAQGRPVGELCGSAIMLSNSNGRVVLVTAQHVVDQLENAKLLHGGDVVLGAQFFGLAGSYFATRHLAGIRESRLDYTILEVVNRPGLTIPPPKSWKLIGEGIDIPNMVETGATKPIDVRTIGNGNCNPWRTTISTQKIVTTSVNSIEFEQSIVSEGNSGGGLFGADGSLIGLVVTADSDNAQAIPFTTIASELEGQNLAIDLKALDYEAIITQLNDKQSGKTAGHAGQNGQENVAIAEAPKNAERATPENASFEFQRVSGDSASFRANLRDVGVSPQQTVLRSGNFSVIAGYNFKIPLDKMFAKDWVADFTFRDGSVITDIPVNLSESVQDAISKTKQKLAQFQYSAYGGNFRFLYPDRDLIDHVMGGWSPDKLNMKLVERAEKQNASYSKDPASLNTVWYAASLPRPIGKTSFFYRVTFLDGSSTDIMEYKIPENDLQQSYDRYETYSLEDGIIFQYRYSGYPAGSGGAIQLTPPPGLGLHNPRLEYDVDSRGFIAADSQRIPWPEGKYKVRYVSVSGEVVGPFTLPKPELRSIVETSSTTILTIECTRTRSRQLCMVNNLNDVAGAREIKISFRSQSRLENIAVPDLTAQVRTAEGRNRFEECKRLSGEECIDFGRKLGLVWDIPTSANDFYYSVAMKSGRKTPVIRVALPEPSPSVPTNRRR